MIHELQTVHARRLSIKGLPIGPELALSDDPTFSADDPKVAWTSQEFVTVWNNFFDSSVAGPTNQSSIWSRVVSEVGTVSDLQELVPTFDPCECGPAEPEIAASNGDDFMVVWQNIRQPTQPVEIFAQRYSGPSSAEMVNDFAIVLDELADPVRETDFGPGYTILIDNGGVCPAALEIVVSFTPGVMNESIGSNLPNLV